jgi:NAD(P)-dependent dehydrogenase (short-subunit alcohol dehydrogenase family)
VTLAVRNLEAGKVVAQHITRVTGNHEVFVRPLDLVDQQSIAAFVADWEGPLHILINNAGIMALPSLERTSGGWEIQFATNFLGHFALRWGCTMRFAAASGARIVSLSSSANMIAPVIFDDLHFDFLPYDPLVAYGQSKTDEK